jgi:hypothetical protein
MPGMSRRRIQLVTGGQTGADRAAFDVALEFGLAYGGWVPRGREDELGAIPARFLGLRETESSDVAERSRRNVRDSDALLVVSHGPVRGGTRVALQEAKHRGKPTLDLDLCDTPPSAAALALERWVAAQTPDGGSMRLNVSGARSSQDGAIYGATYRLLVAGLGLEPADRPPGGPPGGVGERGEPS